MQGQSELLFCRFTFLLWNLIILILSGLGLSVIEGPKSIVKFRKKRKFLPVLRFTGIRKAFLDPWAFCFYRSAHCTLLYIYSTACFLWLTVQNALADSYFTVCITYFIVNRTICSIYWLHILYNLLFTVQPASPDPSNECPWWAPPV